MKTTNKEKIDEIRKVVLALENNAKREADRMNSAYDWYGMENTPKSVDPEGMDAVRLLREYIRKLETE